MDLGKPRYFERNLLFFTDDLPRVRFHSIENLILNLTQAIRDSTQVVQHIAAGNTQWTWENQGILRETFYFSLMTYVESDAIRFRIKF